MNGPDAGIIITALLGGGGLGSLAPIINQWRKGKANPVSAQEVRTSEVAQMAASSGFDEHVLRLTQPLFARIDELEKTAESLEKGRDENRERIMALERRDSIHLFYAERLRNHISMQLPPPPPPWPRDIDPNNP